MTTTEQASNETDTVKVEMLAQKNIYQIAI